MFEQYWGLTASPFHNTADSHWFYESATHEEALARLFYLVEHHRRFGLLCGHAGTGKTMVLQVLESQIRRSQRHFTSVDLIGLDGHGLLWHLSASLGLTPDESASQWQLWRSIEDYFRAREIARAHTVCVLDHIDRSVSDCLAVLQRLLHLTSGQSGTVTFVAASRLNVSQEESSILNELSDLRVEVEPLLPADTADYIRAQLAKSGCTRDIFDLDAIDSIHHKTLGLPRDINRLCEFSLLAGMVMGCDQVNLEVVEAATDELQADRHSVAQSAELQSVG